MFKQSTKECNLVICYPNNNILTRIKLILNEYYIIPADVQTSIYVEKDTNKELPCVLLRISFKQLSYKDRNRMFNAISNLKTSYTILAITAKED